MGKLKNLMVLLAFTAALCISCATPGFGPNGSLFSSTKTGLSGNGDGRGSKTSEGCAHSILGLIGVGGKDVTSLAEDAGIKTIKGVSVHTFSVLGLYANLCTVVVGD
ncbi:MAG: TRL-like family protein [Spirochaetia bacterium]|nr:TRL-like family protein [Spirochaetia bacterium]